MNFKKTYKPQKGYTPICKIGECSLNKLEFGIIELDAGETLGFETGDKETAFIMLEGHCNVTVKGETWKIIGNRQSVFETAARKAFICRSSRLWKFRRSTASRSLFAQPLLRKRPNPRYCARIT